MCQLILFTMKLNFKIWIIFFGLLLTLNPVKSEPITSLRGLGACPIVYMVDELKSLHIFQTNRDLINPDTVGTPQDLIYECHVAAIGKQSPIDFDYNQHVRRYIDIYTIERREQVAQMLGLSEMYFPLMEERLDKYQLPLELKYLAVVESALNPMAVSRTGAVGLWQFKINTGKMFTLNVNSYVDERMDPVKSTDAACQYLQYLYRTFNNWHLALAAYNVGPGAINNAIARSGGETNFWKLYDNLPESAQNYVPAFIAAAYVMTNSRSHGILPVKPIIQYSQTDTVMVRKPVNFAAISKYIDVPVEIIRFLNPTYKFDYIPEVQTSQTLRLPADKTVLFINREKDIYLNSQKPSIALQLEVADSTSDRIKTVHRVKSGDSMHRIAIIYGCTIEDIQKWNPRIDSTLTIGQDITLWISKKQQAKLNYRN